MLLSKWHHITVQVKAKVMRKWVDKMITLAKDGSLHARRQVRSPLWMPNC